MRRSIVFAGGSAVLALVLLAASAVAYVERPALLRVAVASADGPDLDLMAAAGKLLKRGHHGIRLKVVPTDGAAAASAALDGNAADLAVVRADVAMPNSGETVVVLHKDAALLMVLPGGEIEKVGDLAGKRIGLLAARPGDRAMLETALAQYDIGPDAVTITDLTPATIAEAVQAKTVDAVFAVGGAFDGPVTQVVHAVTVAAGAPPVFLPIPEAAAIAQREPAFEAVEVVRGAFGGLPPRPADDLDTLGVTYRLVASSDLGADVVASLTRFLLTQRVALAQAAPLARRMEAPSTDKGSALPVHPGTAAYIDDEEQGFLERYSDFIYIGAMVLGVVASAATAIAGRIGSRTETRADDVLPQLVSLCRQARAEPSVAGLDRLEGEVDTIVASVLEAGCLRSLDERRVSAIHMAVGQVRAAIRDRRDALRRALIPANDRAQSPAETYPLWAAKAQGDQ